MSLRAITHEAIRSDFARQQDLHRSPSQPSLTHTVATEQSDDLRAAGPMTPYTTSLELDTATVDDHGHLLPKGAAPARVGATSAAGGSWGRSSGRSSYRKIPSLPSRAAIPEFVAPAPRPAPHPPQPQYQTQPQYHSQPIPQTEAAEKRKSKRLSLTRSLHDLRERRAADKARKRASTTSEKLPSRVPDLPPALPPVPSIPSMYKPAGPSSRPPMPHPRSRASMQPPPPLHLNSRGSAGFPPPPPTHKSSGFASFIRKLTGKKGKSESSPPFPSVPHISRPQWSGSQRSAQWQPSATTMPAHGPFGSMGRKTRLDNVPHVEAPQSVRGMLSDMKDDTGSIQRRKTTTRQSLIKRVPVPQYSPDDFEPIINPRDLPAPPEPPVEIAAAAEARADAFARLVGMRPAAPSVKSVDSTDSRRFRAPVPPPRTNSLRSKQSTPASKAGSDLPVTPPPEAMDAFTPSHTMIAREVSDEPMPMAEGHPTDGMGIELKSVQRFSVTSQVIVIGPDNPSDFGREALHPPVLNIVTGRSVPPAASARSAHSKISHFSEDESTSDDEAALVPVAAAPERQTSLGEHAPLVIPTPMVGGSPLTFGSTTPRPAGSPQPQRFRAGSPTDNESFGHGFVPPRSVLSRQDSSDDFHSAYGHGSVFGSDAGHGSVYHQPTGRQAMYGGSRSDLGHGAISHLPYVASRSDLGHGAMSHLPYAASRSDVGHGYSPQAAHMFGASRSDIGHGAGQLTHHPFITASRPEFPRRRMSRSDVIAQSRSPIMASRSDLGHGRSPMISRSDLGHAISPMGSRSDLSHGVRGPTRSESGHAMPPRSASSHGLRQASRSDHGHGAPLRGKRSVPDLRLAKTSFPDLRAASMATISRQTSHSDVHSTLSSSHSHHSPYMPQRQISLGDLALSHGSSKRLGNRKMSYDEFGMARLPAPPSSHGHGSASGHGHDSDDFYSALDHGSTYGSSHGHGSNWLHEDPRATPTQRTPRPTRSGSDPRLAGSSPAREAPLGDGLSVDGHGSGGRARLRSLTRKMSKPKQPPTSYDAYAEKQVQLLTRRKSCKPTLHSEASIAAEIHGVADKEDARLMEACFMA